MFGKWAHSNHLPAVGQVAMSLPGPCLSSAIGILTIFARPIVAMSDLSYFNSHCVCLNPRVNLFLICIVSLPFFKHIYCVMHNIYILSSTINPNVSAYITYIILSHIIPLYVHSCRNMCIHLYPLISHIYNH